MYNCRCTKRRTCGKSVMLRKHPDAYKVYPKCPVPGCKGHLNYLPTAKLYDQKRTCYCDAVRYPHRKGAFLNKNEICIHADVDDTMGDPVRVDTIKPGEACPF